MQVGLGSLIGGRSECKPAARLESRLCLDSALSDLGIHLALHQGRLGGSPANWFRRPKIRHRSIASVPMDAVPEASPGTESERPMADDLDRIIRYWRSLRARLLG